MSEPDWKSEAELLRAQLIQCTKAMKEVAKCLRYEELVIRHGHGWVTTGELAEMLEEARGKAVGLDEKHDDYQKLALDYIALDGRNSELANEVTRLRSYKKRFVALAVALDEEPES